MSTKPFFVAAALGVAVLVPAVASAQTMPGSSTTPTVINTSTVTMERETKVKPPPNRLLLGAGAALLGVSYGTSVLVAATSTRPSNDKLYIPVAGPWLALTERECENPHCQAKILSGAMLVADGVAQGAGVIAMGLAFLIPEQVTTLKMQSAKMTVTPTRVGTDGYGVGAVGEF